MKQYEIYKRLRSTIEADPEHLDSDSLKASHRCWYFDFDECPSCVWGHALAENPTAKDLMLKADGLLPDDLGLSTEGSVGHILRRLSPDNEYERSFISFCEMVQEYQDRGRRWQAAWDEAMDDMRGQWGDEAIEWIDMYDDAYKNQKEAQSGKA